MRRRGWNWIGLVKRKDPTDDCCDTRVDAWGEKEEGSTNFWWAKRSLNFFLVQGLLVFCYFWLKLYQGVWNHEFSYVYRICQMDFSRVFRISWAVFKFWIIKCSSNLDVFGSLWDCLHQKEDSFLFLKACRMVTNRLTELENFVVMRFLGSLEGQFALCHLMVKDSLSI